LVAYIGAEDQFLRVTTLSGDLAMATGLILALLFSAQSTTLLVAPPADPVAQADVAYAELSAGNTDAAIERLEAELARNPGQPALLINLGTAYARAGRNEEAREAYREAITARDRVNLELADGSWEDSRKAARVALSKLEQRTAFAVK
jgi:tetratricopeptide (TPR) repeat protein